MKKGLLWVFYDEKNEQNHKFNGQSIYKQKIVTTTEIVTKRV